MGQRMSRLKPMGGHVRLTEGGRECKAIINARCHGADEGLLRRAGGDVGLPRQPRAQMHHLLLQHLFDW